MSPHFSVTVRPRTSAGGCAAVISKKVARLSVDRHRLKRRMLAVVRPWCSPDAALVVYARPGSPGLPFPDLMEELSLLLTRAVGASGARMR